VPKPILEPRAISPDCQKAEIPVFGFVRVKRRRWFLIALVAFFAVVSIARGQGGVPVSPINIVDSLGRPRAGVTVTICTSTGAGTPCTPLASIFTDAGLTIAAANPQTTDGLGNLPIIYAAPGVYKYSVTGTGIAGSLFTATVAGTGGGDAIKSQPNTFTATNTFTQQLVSTVATGTAPFSIASTTVVSNLNVQLHGGLSAPASAILGLTDTQSPTNKTIDISANTLKTATNTAGHVPRNNGTQYVDAQLGFSDLSGTASTAQIGTGTPAASKYVDGGTGAWTALPSGGVSEATLTTGNTQIGGGNTVCASGTSGIACTFYFLVNAHTLTRLLVSTSQAPSGCSTNGQMGVKDITSSTVLTSLTPTATGVLDSGAISISMTAGHQFAIGLTTQSVGCTTFPTFTATATYQ